MLSDFDPAKLEAEVEAQNTSTTGLDCDYLVIGAGLLGLGFTDELLNLKPDTKIIIVDKHSQAGGHWNDDYAFVRLHAPSESYGVMSQRLENGLPPCHGDTKERANRDDILNYFGKVLETMIETGQVRAFFNCFVEPDTSMIRSCTSSKKTFQVSVRKKIVDGTFMKVEIPVLRPPPYLVSAGATVVPPNYLFTLETEFPAYYVLGAGKTAMDSILWLMSRGVPADLVHWIVPRDVYVINRTCHEMPDKDQKRLLEALWAEEWSTGKQGLNIYEKHSVVLRIFADHEPTSLKYAILSQTEIAELRNVQNVVRLGHVQKVGLDSITLQHGSIPMPVGALCIDCTACAFHSRKDRRPIFSDKRITLQCCVPSPLGSASVWSAMAATTAFVEAQPMTEDEKNILCTPIITNDDPELILAGLYLNDKKRQHWERLGIYEVWSKRMGARGWASWLDVEVDPSLKARAVAQSRQFVFARREQR